MFFLAGLGLLRVTWMPVTDLSFDILRLGDIAYLPYMAIVWPLALVGFDIRTPLAWLVMGAGMLLFVLSVARWFETRLSGSKTAVAGLYRFSRHPQYLGWILWSYGFLIYFAHHLEANFKVRWQFHNSLPWLVSTLVILGVAMLEEIRMERELGAEYRGYRSRTPFLLPLPRRLGRWIRTPMRLVIGRERPASGRQVLVTVALYAALLVILSVPFLEFDWPPRGGWYAYPYNVYPFR